MAGIESNADQVAASLGDLAARLADMTPAADAAAAITLPIAVERSPRRTGRLAASLRSVVTATGYTIESDTRYAPAVYARNPWVGDVIRAHDHDQTAAVEQYLDTIVTAA